MTTPAFALPRTVKMAALLLASATLLACNDSLTGIDEDQPSVNMTMIDEDAPPASGGGGSGDREQEQR